MTNACYITSIGKFLPGEPVGNDEMEARLGQIGDQPSRSRQRILDQNQIRQRYYAIDDQQQTRFSNAQMAAQAVEHAIGRSDWGLNDVQLLAAATSQGDLPLPGFASMVHGELEMPACEIASSHGICASGVIAMRHATLAIQAGQVQRAVSVASELASRLLKASRYQRQGYGNGRRLPFEAEFLRWMLSDGAGALLLADRPQENGLSLEVETIAIKSYASHYPPCMFVGNRREVTREETKGWLDYPDYETASAAGAINLHQSVGMLEDVVRICVQGVFDLIEQGRLDPQSIDWWVTHYSSHIFREQAYELLLRGGLEVNTDRVFTNLYTCGNVGSASFPLMLEELLYSGRLQPGERLLCIVPESGRFLFAYVVLKVVGSHAGMSTADETHVMSDSTRTDSTGPELAGPPDIKIGGSALEQSLVRRLAAVWNEFEVRLHQTAIVRKMDERRMTRADYRDLLFNLRQQVIDGSRWISRAASNITRENFSIRSAFIGHSSDEHRDFEMIEQDYVSVDGELSEIQSGDKNIGSAALSEFILSRASRENPFDLIGAMFIIEGLGRRVARRWARQIQDQLQLRPDQVTFLMYHSQSDDLHFQRLDAAVQSGILTEPLVDDIVKTAKVVARLYVLQLEELGNF